jgi:hypothetical protein
MAVGSGITLKESAEADIATPATGKQTLFVDSDAGNELALKDDTGTVTPISGGGTVTNTGTLTASAVIVGNGGVDVKPLASLGTTTTVLHGNAAGLPTFGAVALATDVSGDLPFANLAQGSALSVLGVTGNATADNASIAAGTDNQVMRRSGTSVAFGAVNLASSDAVTGTLAAGNLSTNQKTAGIVFVIDGGGSPITTGVKGFLQIPFACTIVSNTLLSTDAAATSGSIVVDIWKDNYANYPPAVGDTITAAAKPTITTAIKSTDATLTGWTTSISAGDVLGFNVDSVTTLTRVTVQLSVTKT